MLFVSALLVSTVLNSLLLRWCKLLDCFATMHLPFLKILTVLSPHLNSFFCQWSIFSSVHPSLQEKSVQCYFVPEQCVPKQKISDVPTVWQYWVGLGDNRPTNLTQTGLSRQVPSMHLRAIGHIGQDAMFKGRIVQEIRRPREASSKGRIAKGTHCPRDWATKTFRSRTHRSCKLYNLSRYRKNPPRFTCKRLLPVKLQNHRRLSARKSQILGHNPFNSSQRSEWKLFRTAAGESIQSSWGVNYYTV